MGSDNYFQMLLSYIACPIFRLNAANANFIPCWNSKDIACCQKPTFVALYTTYMQCCCNGGIYIYFIDASSTGIWQNMYWKIFVNVLELFCDVYQALPIFLDSLVTAWGAILISVTLILLFGEVRINLRLFKFKVLFNSVQVDILVKP